MPWNTDTFYEHSELWQSWFLVGMLYRTHETTRPIKQVFIITLITTEHYFIKGIEKRATCCSLLCTAACLYRSSLYLETKALVQSGWEQR